MKTTDFIRENKFIGDDAHAMHQDHEVQMARGDCYNAAKYAIELHKLLKNISEMQGLDGWVSEKITLANDYLRTVAEYLRHEQLEKQTQMPEVFTAESAEAKFAALLNEFAPGNFGGGDDGDDDGFDEETLKRLAAQWFNGDEDPRTEQLLAAAGWEIGQDEGYDDEPGVFVVMSGDEHGKSYISWPADELRSGVAEGAAVDYYAKNPGANGAGWAAFYQQKDDRNEIEKTQKLNREKEEHEIALKLGGRPPKLGVPGTGIFANMDVNKFNTWLRQHPQALQTIKQIAQAQPGQAQPAPAPTATPPGVAEATVGQLSPLERYKQDVVTGNDKLDRETHQAGLKYKADQQAKRQQQKMKKGVAENATGGATGAGSIATTPGVGGSPKVGSLFGGSYTPKTPFTSNKKSKQSVIKR